METRKMMTKTGNSFLSHEQYAEDLAKALRLELGTTHQAAKTLMRWTNANERTVKNWMAGSSGPRGEHLIALIKNSDVALAAIMAMADRPFAGTVLELPLLRKRLQAAVEGIDAFLHLGGVQIT